MARKPFYYTALLGLTLGLAGCLPWEQSPVDSVPRRPLTQRQAPSLLPFMRSQTAGHREMAVDGHEDFWGQHGAQEFATALSMEHIQLTPQGQLQLAAGQSEGRFVSAIGPAPFVFNAFMAGWAAETPPGTTLQIQARARQIRGPWTAWLPLEQEHSLLLPHKYEEIQYQFVMKSAQPGRTPVLKAIAFQFGRQVPALKSKSAFKYAPIAKPALMAREAWGALPPKEDYNSHTIDGLVLHHSWLPSQVHYKGAETIRGIQRYHMFDPERNWNDIGYHFLIGPDGTIFQGRPETAIGSHSVPNTGKVGICIIGNYDPDGDPLTPESYAQLLDLMTWLTAEYKIDTQAFFGHRNFSPKSCPGDTVYNRLEEIRAEVERRLKEAAEPPPAP